MRVKAARRALWHRSTTLWLAVGLSVVALGCTDDGAADTTSADTTSADTGAHDSGGDVTADSASRSADVGGFALDEVDLQMFGLLDKLHESLAKATVWPGFPLLEKPLYLVRRSLKGKPRYGLLTHLKEGLAAVEPHAAGEHQVWPTDDQLDFLTADVIAFPYETVAGVNATLAAYSLATPGEPAEFFAALGKASFIRMRELDDKWEPVEGCGLSKYPRKQELLELTLLEDKLLGDIIDATAAQLPDRLTEIMAVRAKRLDLEAQTARIDNDGENRFGAPDYARLTLPVIAGVKTEAAVRAELHARLLKSMSVPLTELDEHLMWKRPLTTAVIMIRFAARIGVPVADTLRKGGTIHDALIIAKGPADLSKIEDVKKRHHSKALVKRATDLMAL